MKRRLGLVENAAGRKHRLVWPWYYAAFTLALGLLLWLQIRRDAPAPEYNDLDGWPGMVLCGLLTVPVTLPVLLIGRRLWLRNIYARDAAERRAETSAQKRSP